MCLVLKIRLRLSSSMCWAFKHNFCLPSLFSPCCLLSSQLLSLFISHNAQNGPNLTLHSFDLTCIQNTRHTVFFQLVLFFHMDKLNYKGCTIFFLKSFHVRGDGQKRRAEGVIGDVNIVYIRLFWGVTEINEWMNMWMKASGTSPTIQLCSPLVFLFHSHTLLLFCFPPFPSPQHPGIAQSEVYESCYLSRHPHPTPLRATPPTIVWQSEQSEGNKGEGQVFEEERMSTVSLAVMLESVQAIKLLSCETGEKERGTEGSVYS